MPIAENNNPYAILNSPLYWINAREIIFTSGEDPNTIGKSRSFHINITPSRIVAAIGAFDSGTSILKRNPKSEQPSIFDASWSSFGIVLKKAVSINIVKDNCQAAKAIISPRCVFIRCKFLKIIKIGIILVTCDSIIPKIKNIYKAFPPLISNRDNLKDTRTAKNRQIAIPPTVTRAVFNI